VRDVVGALLIAATLLLLMVPARLGATPASFAIATVLMVVVQAALVAMPPHLDGNTDRSLPPFVAAMGTAAAIVLVVFLARTWLHQILIFPNDAQRADMLIVIQEGIRRVLRGENPYTMYHVPWEATLPYGPVMWLPYIVPYTLHVDVRFISLLSALFVPAACAIAAAACAWSGRPRSAVALLVLLAALAVSDDLRDFMSIAHTPSYWPLIALFAWIVAREHWKAAAIVCGLLIVARTTMVALAPILVITVWHRDRARFAAVVILLLATTVIPYLPFAAWDPAALKYALYGSYQTLMKGFVWTSTTWAQNTVGATGLLLRDGFQRFVEPTQILTMALIYTVAFVAIRRAAPLPWMALALFAFSATTLWPVSYVYFDVTILWMAAAIGDVAWYRTRSVAGGWCASLSAAGAALLLATVIDVRADPAIDVGIGETRAFLYKGFSNDEGASPSFAWIEGTSAEILVPRRSRAAAEVEMVIEPFLPTSASSQQLSVTLNGFLLHTATLQEGWHTIAFPAPARAWRIGVNELVLSLSQAVAPQDVRTSDDTRKLSAALDRLTVRTKS